MKMSEKLASTKKPPEWMQSEKGDGLAEYLAAVEPDILVEWTRFAEAYPNKSDLDPEEDDGAHLFKLIQSTFFRHVRTVLEWKEQANSYPSAKLETSKNRWISA
jgi:hypothetical protein